ncbi:MAG: hypothetical protein M3146_06685 [Thermoproteota archaeon]|nr:hypothetical protein [Thermoproteota archaeon]
MELEIRKSHGIKWLELLHPDLSKEMMIMESELAKRKADLISAEPVFAAAESL